VDDIICGVAVGEAAADSEGKHMEEVLARVVVICSVAVGEVVTDNEGECSEGREDRGCSTM
jgi:hypothetical protein